jgi:hypothetical protein
MKHWNHPVLVGDDGFERLWSRPREDPLLFIAGSGFDPRAVTVLERLVAVTPRRVDALIIELPGDATDEAVRPLALKNGRRIETLITNTGGQLRLQALPSYEDARTLGLLISRQLLESGILDGYGEVIVEISALPRGVFFPLLRGVLQIAHLGEADERRWAGDLHVAVCENPEIDESVLEEGTTPMATIGGFSGPRGPRPKTTIWVPVLGERTSARARAVWEQLEPDETCPVLPWPARDPRRGDRLLLEHRRLLFDDIGIEARNVIHAAERNPFDLYRTLGALHERYLRSLSSLGTVGMVLSSHSSKLLSVGVLLTAYENGLVVQHVSPGRYGLRDGAEALHEHDEIYDLWLTGEPYRR